MIARQLDVRNDTVITVGAFHAGSASNIIEKSGAWFAYNGEKIGQGRDNSREFLRENPALATEIENKVRAHLGVPLIIDAAPPQAANEELADKPRKVKAA